MVSLNHSIGSWENHNIPWVSMVKPLQFEGLFFSASSKGTEEVCRIYMPIHDLAWFSLVGESNRFQQLEPNCG